MRAILMYHSIDDSGSVISVSPAVFAEHVRWIARRGLRVLSLDDLFALDPTDDRDAIAITFDDGFANVIAAATPLREQDLTATVFVVTGHVGRTNAWGGRTPPGIPTLPLLDWSSLEHLIERGFSIGGHTHSHPPLTTLSADAVTEELDRCAGELRTRLGVEPSVLAYPYGAVDAAVAAIASNRFRAAVTTRFAAFRGTESPMRIPRLDMYYFRAPGAIDRWGRAAFTWWLDWVRFRRFAGQTIARPPMVDSDARQARAF